MKWMFGFLLLLFVSCDSQDKKGGEGKEQTNPNLEYKKELPQHLNEVSGMYADGEYLWVITDKPKSQLFKIDKKGNLVQEINIKHVDAIDVEAVTADSQYVYVGDVGDNEGSREGRQIIRVLKSGIPTGDKVEVTGDVINFSFSTDSTDGKKKHNNFDCESVLSYGDKLYLFTKRREDFKTELYSLPKTPGTYTPTFVAAYDSKGLVTDAAINKAGNEVSLIGYGKGHKFPFIVLFTNFKDTNFFSGTEQRINLADKDWDWQLESITYDSDGNLYMACEQTKEVKSTFYVVKREKILKLDKKK